MRPRERPLQSPNTPYVSRGFPDAGARRREERHERGEGRERQRRPPRGAVAQHGHLAEFARAPRRERVRRVDSLVLPQLDRAVVRDGDPVDVRQDVARRHEPGGGGPGRDARDEDARRVVGHRERSSERRIRLRPGGNNFTST